MEVSGADIAVPLDAGPVVVEAIPADEPVPVPAEVLSPAIDAPVCPPPPRYAPISSDGVAPVFTSVDAAPEPFFWSSSCAAFHH